jgi:hypothetical protein
MRNHILGRRGFASLGVVELMLAVSMSAFLLAWVASPLRSSRSASARMADTWTLDALERSMTTPTEDIREALSSTIAWSALDPTAGAGYDPLHFPWFQLVSMNAGPTATYVCYYYDPGVQTFWRVQTAVAPASGAICDSTASGAAQTPIATNVLAPSAAAPLFSADAFHTVTFNVRVSPSSALNNSGPVTVTRMAAPRS